MRALPCLFVLLFSLVSACTPQIREQNDLSAAREAAAEQDWGQAARLAQRYLRDENDPAKRWQAWNLMVTASRHMGELRWTVDDLETMLLEFGDNDAYTSAVLRQMAEAYEGLRQWDKAAAVWLHLLDVEEFSDDEAAKIYRRMGIFFLRGQDYGMAEDMLEMCADQSGDSAVLQDCYFYLAQAYSGDQKPDLALAQLSQLLAMNEATESLKGQALFWRGDILEQQSKVAEAKQAFTDALPLHPNPIAVQKRLDYLEKTSKK